MNQCHQVNGPPPWAPPSKGGGLTPRNNIEYFIQKFFVFVFHFLINIFFLNMISFALALFEYSDVIGDPDFLLLYP